MQNELEELMAKTPLIERMAKKGAPKSWITEIVSLYLQIENLQKTIDEYLDIIDVLARRVEAFEANTSKSVLRRLNVQLND